ncbi:Pre-rRNA-processing protein esf2 [Cladophialophora carrionii]|uniref:Pre-rRNA-processing protein ESF2 n=1 Tax=Cladophialophora carrionii TaxID=86049 RepID=A0A1C1C7V0_9EURO|nr:Pre-rRNA-processing protein esf2 [Cladophialophora carrionii]
MAVERRNTYLDAGVSDESDRDTGYDSEAAEISKARRTSKRRKIQHEYTDQEDEDDEDDEDEIDSRTERRTNSTLEKHGAVQAHAELKQQREVDENNDSAGEDDNAEPSEQDEEPERKDRQTLTHPQSEPATSSQKEEKKKKKVKDKDKKKPTPGVVYLSSLPPYLKPSALRNLLDQRGFSPIARIFLSPASKSNKSHSAGGKNSRQLYTEGWIEFASKKTAKRCAETLNASTVGGKKGGYYRDDVWNMKYLRGMRWEELMAGVREEKREMEGRRDEERRTIARETKMFVEGVEEGRRREGMKRKREQKKKAPQSGGRAEQEGDGPGDPKRTWRQNEVLGSKRKDQTGGDDKISDDVRQVLGKIF